MTILRNLEIISGIFDVLQYVGRLLAIKHING